MPTDGVAIPRMTEWKTGKSGKENRRPACRGKFAIAGRFSQIEANIGAEKSVKSAKSVDGCFVSSNDFVSFVGFVVLPSWWFNQ